MDNKGIDGEMGGPPTDKPATLFFLRKMTVSSFLILRYQGLTMQTKCPLEEAGRIANTYASEATTIVTSEIKSPRKLRCTFR